ncbi:MAG: phosphoribosylglycinamide formyltransferase [Candidatus Parabeggiatoa sp. nov. 3]|nr:MAG: phosphoribosylglycinamide formyltransferase [Gammaproteobacteria bacterium]RKZ67692.1 MAG: phosphoribosylglycinamide formyltransferase [Gammaproteobacteria bacterium]RKZ85540.1 MAG: phosphoribosylglycinamide formyltransferase [Gammaproteobacteria bacterium]HEW98174.1 phosphoribosylglycinamide formyltransferase [Beggiatoa sp.]
MAKLPLVALISGRGSNLKAIIDAADPLIEIRAVISNRPQAPGLLYAQQAGIATQIIDHKTFKSRLEFDTALQTAIDHYQPKLVILAGFMRILSPDFIKHYRGCLLNIHPSLLPAFKGLHTHQRVLQSNMKEHGTSVHFVTEELDSGPVIIQARVPVLPDDDEDSLAARVLQEEHRIYPQAIHWFAQGRLKT